MIAAAGTAYAAQAHGLMPSPASITNSAASAGAIVIDMTDIMRVPATTIAATGISAAAAIGFIASAAPKPVATALPPRKPEYSGQTCPQTAANAQTAAIHARSS